GPDAGRAAAAPGQRLVGAAPRGRPVGARLRRRPPRDPAVLQPGADPGRELLPDDARRVALPRRGHPGRPALPVLGPVAPAGPGPGRPAGAAGQPEAVRPQVRLRRRRDRARRAGPALFPRNIHGTLRTRQTVTDASSAITQPQANTARYPASSTISEAMNG